MARKISLGFLILVSSAIFSTCSVAAEPSLHDVYQAAEADKLDAAQTMMHEVLAAHPDSGKAHFVEAELLAKQGQLKKAEGEFSTAERLAPGLPFAKPQAVQDLKARLGLSRNVQSAQTIPANLPVPASISWGWLLTGLALIALLVWFVRALTQRNAMPVPVGDFGRTGVAGVPPSYGSQAPSYGPGGAWPGPAQPGLGSRVMSGLATGAAVGAGVVAGEALMHRFMGGNEQRSGSSFSNNQDAVFQDSSLDDMGGADFGISDTSSWDDSSGGGDWN